MAVNWFPNEHMTCYIFKVCLKEILQGFKENEIMLWLNPVQIYMDTEGTIESVLIN